MIFRERSAIKNSLDPREGWICFEIECFTGKTNRLASFATITQSIKSYEHTWDSSNDETTNIIKSMARNLHTFTVYTSKLYIINTVVHRNIRPWF